MLCINEPYSSQQCILMLPYCYVHAEPGPPTNVELIKDAVLLWQPPDTPNGVIQGYDIQLTYENRKLKTKLISVDSDTFSYNLTADDAKGKPTIRVKEKELTGIQWVDFQVH